MERIPVIKFLFQLVGILRFDFSIHIATSSLVASPTFAIVICTAVRNFLERKEGRKEER
jgi:hypothetical protein